jgi:hypothetical protein
VPSPGRCEGLAPGFGRTILLSPPDISMIRLWRLPSLTLTFR